MAITHATWATARRASFGTLRYKQLYNTTWAYTETLKKVAAGSTTAVLAATNGATTAQTIDSGITQPDVPRALSVTPTANTTGSPLSVVVNGTNIEGKPLAKSFIIAANSTSTVNGADAFKTVSSVVIPGNSVGLTITVGTRNLLGVNHRLFNQNTTVKVWSATSTNNGALTLEAQPTVAASENEIERNTVSPATTPDGSKFYIIGYSYDNFQGDGSSVNDQPEYSTTTSTSSTSTSTSTTTITTSTSSTSISTSSTSTSSTSTSTSTSSTSTSTTTAP